MPPEHIGRPEKIRPRPSCPDLWIGFPWGRHSTISLSLERGSRSLLKHCMIPVGVVATTTIVVSVWLCVFSRIVTTSVGYGGSQCLDHETGKIRCIQTDAVGSDQSTKCSSAGVR